MLGFIFSHRLLRRWGNSMPKRVDQYRLNAMKCFELSQTFKEPDARRALFAMADAWLKLATRHVKNIEMLASDRRSVPCPRCHSPMAWYSADLTDDRRALLHSYRCEVRARVSAARIRHMRAFCHD